MKEKIYRKKMREKNAALLRKFKRKCENHFLRDLSYASFL